MIIQQKSQLITTIISHLKFHAQEQKKAFAESLESALNEHMPKW